MKSDEELETFLRKFQPRAPRPLSLEAPRRRLVDGHGRRWGWLLAAAAVVAMAVGIWRLPGGGARRVASPRPAAQSPPVAGISAGVGASLLWRDPVSLDRLLDEESRRALPRVDAAGGALRSLASVGKDL
jgi:hypothetical protein